MSTDVLDAAELALAATKPEQPDVMLPESDMVTLPIGLATPRGVITKVKVRELNGYDEEAMARAKTIGQLILTVLERATVKVGDEDATPGLLREMFMADRLAVLVGISRITWGSVTLVPVSCRCGTTDLVEFDLDDLEVTPADPADSVYTVPLKEGSATVHWPKGDVHEAILHMEDLNTSQFRSVLLDKCVVEINGIPMAATSSKRLSIPDRSALVKAVNEVYLGPRFDKTSATCSNCGEEITPALTLGAMFPF